MIFIDTSVWIDYFKGKNVELVEKLNTLLDSDLVALTSISYLELMTGVRKTEVQTLKRVLSALPLYFSTQCSSQIQQIEAWILEGIAVGQRFGAADLLIAATVKENDGYLWSHDSDFKRMSKLGFLNIWTPS